MGEPVIKEKDLTKDRNQPGSTLTYLEWNNEIAKHFFKPNKANTRVWFSVEKELIEKIAQKNNSTFEGFITAVKKGPDRVNHSNQKICSKAYTVHDHWINSEKKFEYPPYIAYLALFVLAVNHGESDDFSENNYYGRLRKVLGEEPTPGQYPSFQKMWELWLDLEKWLSEAKQGSLGDFHCDIYGKNAHVGILYYQVVLRKKDNLPKIFRNMGWDSDSKPTEEEIIKALKSNQNFLSARTSKRVEKGNQDFQVRLTDRVLEELKNYDEEDLANDENQESERRGTIEICLDIDNTAQTAEFYFRCKRKAGLPEENFILKGGGSEYEITSSSATVSQKIKGLNIDNWLADFPTESGKYKFNYKGEKYKLFTPAKNLGVSGWIAGQRYVPNELFYLAVHKSLINKVKKWGERECDKLEDLKFMGLPKDWHLFKIHGVNGDNQIKQDIPALAIDKKMRINFEGGIRLTKGNKFFNFAPPKIEITGGVGQILTPNFKTENQEEVVPLIPDSKRINIFALPKEILLNETSLEKKIEISIQNPNSGDNPKKSFRLFDSRLKKISDYSEVSENQVMDCFGNLKKIYKKELSNESSLSVVSAEPSQNLEKLFIQGAYSPYLKNKSHYPRLPSTPITVTHKVYLVGDIPGQIISWQKEDWHESWTPAWMIQFKTYKKAKAFLIESTKVKQEYNADKSAQKFSKEKIRLWKKIIWHKRKQIKAIPKVKKQWSAMTERAKNV